jgi:chaperone required for assembly of F1-ATPase
MAEPAQAVKRFYKTVSVEPEGEGFGIRLDSRPVKTPARNVLALPNAALAEAIAEEWRTQGETVDPRSMPLTGLANAAIDRIAEDPGRFARDLAAYGETDLLCYRAGDPPELVARQEMLWNPLLDWARARYDIGFALATGIIHRPQPANTIARLAEAIGARDAFELAAFSPLVTISGSLVIALALAEGVIATDAAFDAAHLDELWQAEKWGEDSLASQAREARRRDFLAAARFHFLLRSS